MCSRVSTWRRTAGLAEWQSSYNGRWCCPTQSLFPVTKTIVANTQQASQSVTVEDSTSTTLGSPQFVTYVIAATEHLTNHVRI